MRILALLLLIVTAARPARPQDERGRPLIVLVHGRGMVDRDTTTSRKLWLEALRSGSAVLTPTRLIEDRDIRLVWYADVLDPESDAGCDYAASDPRARRALGGDEALRSLAGVAGGLFGALARLAEDKEAATQLRALAADAAFLGDKRKRCAAEGRLQMALDRARSEGRPVVLVAHSLGSLVAYDYLSSRSDTGSVRVLATLGSPLGSADLRRLLIGGDEADTLAPLPSVREWINVRNEGDPFAMPVPIARDVVIAPPADEPDPHELVGYLRERESAGVILGAWCRAFRSNAPKGCDEIVPP